MRVLIPVSTVSPTYSIRLSQFSSTIEKSYKAFKKSFDTKTSANLDEFHSLFEQEFRKFYYCRIMQVSISSITIPPPAYPRGFAPKTSPHPGAFASKLLPGGEDLLGSSRGAGICL